MKCHEVVDEEMEGTKRPNNDLGGGEIPRTDSQRSRKTTDQQKGTKRQDSCAIAKESASLREERDSLDPKSFSKKRKKERSEARSKRGNSEGKTRRARQYMTQESI
jgi:hypothetical protein